MGFKGRDIEAVKMDDHNYIVIACDSAGAIGDKEFDVVKAPPELVGALTARVAILELLAVGSNVKMLSAAICCEPEPTGRRILNGINEELKRLGNSEMPIAISTEKNFLTSQTGVGVTAVGTCEASKLRIGCSRAGDIVHCIGIPKIGNEIEGAEDEQIVKAGDIEVLLSTAGVNDILPVGSNGILKEATLMANVSGKQFKADMDIKLDMKKSAGPSTCAIFSCSPETEVSRIFKTPVSKIGIIC